MKNHSFVANPALRVPRHLPLLRQHPLHLFLLSFGFSEQTCCNVGDTVDQEG
eukprot:m.185647 g.185647  ORF g.185647 m.185647 type:complete len:52 (-) comp15033_c0_seq2:97-252(-)